MLVQLKLDFYNPTETKQCQIFSKSDKTRGLGRTPLAVLSCVQSVHRYFILSIKRPKTFLSSFIEFLFPLPGLLRAETRARVQVNGLARLHPELK